MVRTRIENNNNGRVYTCLPDYWEIPIKTSYLEYCQEFIENEISLNVYLKKIVIQVSNEKVDLSNFSYNDIVLRFSKKNKKKKWRSLFFDSKQMKIIYKHIQETEHKTQHKIRNDYYILACLYEALPFLRSEYKKQGK